ncbi:hypothetical protein FIE12Z_12039 [Fusarium flagelliforme]|uniref:Uncharacterized protein n=1 Tax=Fusarium flagelliforme TaxID=2675880 RepID=A0A395M773_9HYPO|nr:hypothetical protein FIE12Z_12039 [Fusarium flagelliforme]
MLRQLSTLPTRRYTGILGADVCDDLRTLIAGTGVEKTFGTERSSMLTCANPHLAKRSTLSSKCRGHYEARAMPQKKALFSIASLFRVVSNMSQDEYRPHIEGDALDDEAGASQDIVEVPDSQKPGQLMAAGKEGKEMSDA